jgi:hypothetical protein
VNRLWERFFGVGIVATTEDFGTRAEYPSHPELLDWLATEFVGTHWNLKGIIKEMLMSATYRQSSDLTPEVEKRDPANRLLARGPRFRLPAEVLRDQALSAAGLLVEKIGGRSVRPYQPAGIWDETAAFGNLVNYKHDKGEGLYRKSLYTIWKRTAAPPEMTLFDVPSREICRISRARTNTPLQALILLNDVTYVEAARKFAERMILNGGPTAKGRLQFAYRTLLSRDPSASEESLLEAGIKRDLEHYHAQQKAAAELLEQTRLPYLSRLTNQARAQNPELSRKEAEDIAMASEDYRTHILEAIEARQRADIVKAKWEAVKALADGLRTAEASRRAERNSYTR